MTEAIENGTVLVRLRAVAMERDDNSEGWVPIGTGGLSNVCIVKRLIQVPLLSPDAPTATSTSSLPGAPAGVCPERVNYNNNNSGNNNNNNNNVNNGRYEFVIYANKLNDDELVFRCIVCKDFKYNKVMPTFHNWYNGGKRVGLVFLTAADARVFDRGIMSALVDLSAGMDLLHNESSDNEVFMAVELPYKMDNKRKQEGSSRHVSPTSTDSSSFRGTPSVSESEVKSYRPKPLSSCEQNSLLHHPPTTLLQHHHNKLLSECVKIRSTGYPPPSPPSPQQPPTFSSSHHHNPLDSPVMCKKSMAPDQAELDFPVREEKPQRLTCKHCRKSYTQEENDRGSCEFAPDYVRTCIDTVTCIPCARSMMYHCMSDSEGNFAQPCECDTVDSGCIKRWMSLGLLSIILPCLWCYMPMKVCHLCGVSCGACGGRHEPLSTPSTATS